MLRRGDKTEGRKWVGAGWKGGVRENQGGDQVWGDWQEEKTGRENGNAFSY